MPVTMASGKRPNTYTTHRTRFWLPELGANFLRPRASSFHHYPLRMLAQWVKICILSAFSSSSRSKQTCRSRLSNCSNNRLITTLTIKLPNKNSRLNSQSQDWIHLALRPTLCPRPTPLRSMRKLCRCQA